MPDAPIPVGAPLPISTTPHRRAPPTVDPQIRHVADEFESVFLNEMMAPMFEGLDTDGLGGRNDGEHE